MPGKILQNPGAGCLRFVKLRKIDHRDSGQVVPHQPVHLQKPGNGLTHRLLLHGQQPRGGGNQLVLRQEAVPASEVIIQFK